MELDKLILEIEFLTKELNRMKEENREIYAKSCKVEKQNKKLKLQLKETQDQATTGFAQAKYWERKYDEIYFNRVRNSEAEHNERGAGRKSKFTDKQIEEIKKLREEGKTIKEIAAVFECGTATINRMLKK